MRGNSGQGEGTNNNRNPTLRDHERDQGQSGEAITGGKKAGNPADRISNRSKQDG